MIKTIFLIFASFGWITASKVEIKENKLHEKHNIFQKTLHIRNFGKFKNFFTAISNDHVACNYQARCQRVFVNIEALTKNPWWMKIDLQSIMPELEGKQEKMWLFMDLKRTYTLFETTVLREYQVSNIHALKLNKNWTLL